MEIGPLADIGKLNVEEVCQIPELTASQVEDEGCWSATLKPQPPTSTWTQACGGNWMASRGWFLGAAEALATEVTGCTGLPPTQITHLSMGYLPPQEILIVCSFEYRCLHVAKY